ncbi:MAG: LysR family transcriptional regulator [Bradyrhizobium sp.]|nr:LysR family transcriptional regulator [Bradyrhizobium sp.]
MDLRQLRYFRQIAACGSFSAASGMLHVAQPALSRQMHALEHELGAKLFHRTGRGILLTAAGHALLEDAVRLLEDAEQIGRRVRSFGNRLAGEATIGLSPTIGRLLTLPLAVKVKAECPELTLRIAEAFSGTLLEWLQTGRLDAAILYHMPANGAVRSEMIASEPLSIIAGPGEASFLLGATVPITGLVGKPIVLSTPSHGLRRMVDEHAAAAGAKLDLLFEFDSLDSTIAVVRQGMALTILPESAVRAELDAGTLLAWRISDPEFVRPLVIATAAQRADAIGTRELANLLRSVIVSASAASGWRIVEGA